MQFRETSVLAQYLLLSILIKPNFVAHTCICLLKFTVKMLPSTFYFKNIPCPFAKSGSCLRPYCHFKHDKSKGKFA